VTHRRSSGRPRRRSRLTRSVLRSASAVCAAIFVAAGLSGCDRVGALFGKTPAPSASPAAPSAPLVPEPSPSPLGPPPFDSTVFEQMTGMSQTSRIPVIMYHDVIEKRGRGSVYFDCTREEFEQQIQFLEEKGATPISLEQLHRHLTRGEAVPERAVVLTFDDNYQGFYDIAYPLLKERNWPCAVFVHTNFVGDKASAHPKMDWDTLKQLDAEGLVTIASHTLSHPDDMAKLPLEEQEKELRESKRILEEQLGHPVPYFAYPNGKGDAKTYRAAMDAGYTMAFTINNGPVEESPSVLALNRYIHTRLEKAWQECEDALYAVPAAVIDKELKEGPVTLEVREYEGVKLGIVRGGKPTTRRSTGGVRQSVGEFVLDAGGVAGMNGTFFANAYLRGNDNVLIGPSKTANDIDFQPETAQDRLPRLRNRPLIIFGPNRLLVAPFQPGFMNDEFAIKALMPDYTDCFLAGAWIVHNGQARTAAEMRPYAAQDFNDPRRRACFGFTEAGEMVLIGSLKVITTETLAKAVAAAGVQEAFLLDSGFSTSVVYDNKIIVTGHTAKHLPSRPVPHAIVLTGALTPPLDPETEEELAKAEEAVGEISAAEAQAAAPGPSSTRRRRR